LAGLDFQSSGVSPSLIVSLSSRSGVILVDSTDDGLSAVLKNFSSMDRGRRIEIGGNNSDAFIKYFTAPKFAEDYVNIIVNN
jgi:hypothetical protein